MFQSNQRHLFKMAENPDLFTENLQSLVNIETYAGASDLVPRLYAEQIKVIDLFHQKIYCIAPICTHDDFLL